MGSVPRQRILLVEDNPGDALLVRRLLPDRDFEHVTTIAKALTALEDGRFDVALLDLHLPDGSGSSLVTRLNKRAPLLPIVVITGSMTADGSALAALAQGAQDWLPKDGLDADRLRRAINYAVERKAFEQRSAESEERFRQLADNTHSIFWILTADLSETIYVNAAYDRIIGSNRDRFYADPMEWRRVVHPDDRSRAIEGLARLGRGEAPLDMRVRILRPDNTIRWVHLKGFTIRNPAGEIYRIAGTVDDVTKLQEAEEQVAAANERLANILDTAAEGIYGIDLHGHITFVNQAGAAMLGRVSEALLGKHAHTLFHHTHDDGTPHPAAECSIYTVMQDGRTRREERDVFWRADGSKLPVTYVSSPMVVNGHVEGAVVVFADITERLRAQQELAQAEARLRAMFESSASRILLTDEEGVVLASNEAGSRGGPAISTGTSIFDLLPHPSLVDRYEATLAAAREGRCTHWVGELPDSGLALDVTVTPLVGREILWESRDVTELVQARREAEQAKARVEEIQRFRVRLLNTIAHDMGTPLMVLQLRLDSVARQPATPDGTRSIDERTFDALKTSTIKLIALTRDLRDVSLMEAGSFRLHVRPVDVVALARSTADELSDIAARSNVRIVTKLPDEALVVKGDETRLAQALTNLITNAIKFTPPQGEVTLRAARNSGHVHLEVTDTGPGVPPDARPRLFAPFSQVHQDTDVKKGTGLGLYIVRGIMRAHGGDAELLDTPAGQGATFRLQILAAEDAVNGQGA